MRRWFNKQFTHILCLYAFYAAFSHNIVRFQLQHHPRCKSIELLDWKTKVRGFSDIHLSRSPPLLSKLSFYPTNYSFHNHYFLKTATPCYHYFSISFLMLNIFIVQFVPNFWTHNRVTEKSPVQSKSETSIGYKMAAPVIIFKYVFNR